MVLKFILRKSLKNKCNLCFLLVLMWKVVFSCVSLIVFKGKTVFISRQCVIIEQSKVFKEYII